MNPKLLAKKLEKKTQQIIEKCTCECGKPINYILCGHGSASVEVHYEKTNTERINILSQDGKSHSGFISHKCKENKD